MPPGCAVSPTKKAPEPYLGCDEQIVGSTMLGRQMLFESDAKWLKIRTDFIVIVSAALAVDSGKYPAGLRRGMYHFKRGAC